MIKKILIFMIIFFLGAITTSIYADLASSDPEISNPFSTSATERPSPADRIQTSDIHVYDDKIIIDVKDPIWARFTNTNSMDPVIDEDAHAIEVKPKENTLKVGDIIAYKPRNYDGSVIHRIVEIGEDEQGKFYTVKGDNNSRIDPERVRFDQIESVVIAILY